MKRILFLLFPIFLLVGCVAGRVNTFSNYEIPPKASFAIIGSEMPTPTERNIQKLISDEMVKRGYVPAINTNKADLAITYNYSIGEGQTVISSKQDSYGRNKITSETEYPRYFIINLIDIKKSDQAKKIVIIWQGEVYSSGGSSNINRVAGAFVEAIFEQFGKSVTNERFVGSADL